jgi:hypothetical protein
MPDPLAVRLVTLELAFRSLAELLHRQRVAPLGALADAMETRAGVLAVAGDPALGDLRDALAELIVDLRETAAELGSGDT